MAGDNGKVISDAKFIETGMIGTMNIPSNIRFTPTTIWLPEGTVKIATATIKVTITQMSLVVIRYYWVFCKIAPTTKLERTPTMLTHAP